MFWYATATPFCRALILAQPCPFADGKFLCSNRKCMQEVYIFTHSVYTEVVPAARALKFAHSSSWTCFSWQNFLSLDARWKTRVVDWFAKSRHDVLYQPCAFVHCRSSLPFYKYNNDPPKGMHDVGFLSIHPVIVWWADIGKVDTSNLLEDLEVGCGICLRKYHSWSTYCSLPQSHYWKHED